MLRLCDRWACSSRLGGLGGVARHSKVLLARALSNATSEDSLLSDRSTGTSTRRAVTVHSTEELALLLCRRFPRKSFEVAARSFDAVDASTAASAKWTQKSRQVQAFAKIDQWAAEAVRRFLQATGQSKVFPLELELPPETERSAASAQLYESLKRAKSFVSRGKFTATADAPSSERIDALVAALLSTLPPVSVEPLCQAINSFAAEELNESKFLSRMSTLMTHHCDAFEDVASFLELELKAPVIAKLHRLKYDRNVIIARFAQSLEVFVNLAMTSAKSSAEVTDPKARSSKRAKKEDSDNNSNGISNSGSSGSSGSTNNTVSLKKETARRKIAFNKKYCFNEDLKCVMDPAAEASSSGMAQSERKFFIGNIVDTVDETRLKFVLSSLGNVQSLRLFRVDTSASVEQQQQQQQQHLQHPVATIAESIAQLEDDDEEDIVHASHIGVTTSMALPSLPTINVLDESALDSFLEDEQVIHDIHEIAPQMVDGPSPRNPLATFAAISIVSKKLLSRKNIASRTFNENYAFVLMSTEEGYQRAIDRDIRVFGICIERHICRTAKSSTFRSLRVEILRVMELSAIVSLLKSILPASIEVPASSKAESCPMFVSLFFESHSSAWTAFELLEAAAQDEETAPICVTWTKTNWFYKVQEKDNEWKLHSLDLAPFFDGKEAEEQHSSVQDDDEVAMTAALAAQARRADSSFGSSSAELC